MKSEPLSFDVLTWLKNAHQKLEEYKVGLNSINVFPVADADTGSNMVGTLAAALDPELTTLAERVRACLLGAHGNSGTILAAWLAGFLEHFDETSNSIDLLPALKDGAARARGVLLDPAPGTILDVMDALTTPQSMAIDAYKVIGQTALIQAKMLNTDTATADAGAVGFLLVVNSLAESLGLAAASWEKIALFVPSSAQIPSAINGNSLEVELMFDLVLPSEKEVTLRDVLSDLGNSVTLSAVKQDGTLKHIAVHVHTSQDQKILKFARRLGTVDNVRITELTCQPHE